MKIYLEVYMDIKELFKKTKHFFFKNKKFNYYGGLESKVPVVMRQFCNEGSKILYADKKWGSELIICRSPHACKVMVLEPDTQVSMHWHEEKSETFVLIEGEMIVETIILESGHKDKIILNNKFDSITLPPRVPHTFYCPVGQEEPTVFIEASSEDRSYDNYRIFPSQGKDVDNGRSDN
jgi:mannose-6-phosphate isomerase-like protein (cupin superfamily)